MALENCGTHGQQLIDLLGCLAQKQGQKTAEYVNAKLEEVIGVHGVDVDELKSKIDLINAELDADDVAFQGILDAIAALQTAVANNQVSITNVNNAVTSAKAALEASIAAERDRVNAELARIEALIPNGYDDSELRGLIQANVEAIGSESATRVAEIARLEGLITANTADINALKSSVAANVAAISSLTSDLNALTSTVAANAAAINARVDSVEGCLNSYFGVLDGASCDAIFDSFVAGMNAGNGGAL